MRKMGLFWFAAALLGAALIFAGCETEADEKIVYLPGEMIHLDVVVTNVTDLKLALADDKVLAIGFDGNSDNTLDAALTIPDGKAIYILNGGELKTDGSGKNLTVEGVVYVGIGGKLDTSAGNVIVDGGQVSVLPAKSVAAITAGVPPGTLVIANALNVFNSATPAVTALGGDNVWIGGALELTTPTEALINTAFTDYVKAGGAVNVAGTAGTVADNATVTVPAGKSLNVAATGKLVFTNNTSTVVLLVGASLEATDTSVLASEGTTTADGSGISLTVAAAGTLGTPTGYTSNDPSPGASIVLTSATAGTQSATAYVIGNASFTIAGLASDAGGTAAVVSTAAATAAIGGITAGTGTAVILAGSGST
jgi:hypothetical protein